MHKGGKIILSLIIFVGLFTIPLVYNMGKANAGPEIDTEQLEYMQSIEPAIDMKADHPQLFDQWRDEFVRNGKTEYINSQGKSFDIDIETLATSDPSGQLCVSCHDYTAVTLTCTSCHELGGSTK